MRSMRPRHIKTRFRKVGVILAALVIVLRLSSFWPNAPNVLEDVLIAIDAATAYGIVCAIGWMLAL
jgi:hypothetical protein